jgi:hypothetical protein
VKEAATTQSSRTAHEVGAGEERSVLCNDCVQFVSGSPEMSPWGC